MEKAPGFESAKALVVQYLEAYNDRARKIALLRYELGHVAQVSPNEMIDAMSFSLGDFGCMTPHPTKGTSLPNLYLLFELFFYLHSTLPPELSYISVQFVSVQVVKLLILNL